MANVASHWCILRTNGGRTLALAASLNEAGIEAWTPIAIRNRLVRRGRTMRKAEVSRPILPTFVFARAAHVDELRALTGSLTNPHPRFSIFHDRGIIPLVGEASIAALREAEAVALAEIQEERDAETRAAKRQERAALLRTAQAQRKALRAVRRDFEQGASVTVTGMPALAGLSGRIVQSDGGSAVVFFGGSLTMRIEAWQLAADAVEGGATGAA